MTASARIASAPVVPPDADRIDAVHRAIRADSAIQFDLPPKPVEPPAEAPEWLLTMLRGVGHFVEWVGGGWAVLGWAALALLAAVLVYAFVPGFRDWLAARFRRVPDTPVAEESWKPAERDARALLAEAEALAGQERYDAALRLILHRSIADIAAWRGGIVAPSRTSRDIARAEALPMATRGVFDRIVAAVERSLFGGRPVDRTDWERARRDYAALALGDAA